MEVIILALICLPFLSALILSIVKNNTARQIVTYVSSACLVGLGIIFAVGYFTKGNDQLYFFAGAEAVDRIMLIFC